jgi:hypothetical protein
MPAYDDNRFAPPAPAARVSLRHPDHGERMADVSMLIDSGADVSLLSRSEIASLGIKSTSERYELVAFDGTVSEAGAVRADLVFLGRRFRGQFLLVDSEAGVLGRDVLNHVRLLLDGPGMSWEEWRSPAREV